MNMNPHPAQFARSQSMDRSRRVFLGFVISVVLLAPSLLFAQDAKLSPEKIEKIENAVSKFMSANAIPGLSVAVVHDGKYAWSEGFGMADLENFVPATPRTLYRLGSISKPLTAIAAMQLWERGKLDLDAPVQKYCPSFPQKEWPITTREALGHLAGIRHYHQKPKEDLEGNNVKHFDDPIQAGLNFFENDPLVAKPGTKFSYSTQGFTLVGCSIEGASGKIFVEFIRENVFVPAHMTRTQPDDRYAIMPFRTRFYSRNSAGAVINADFLDSSYKIPGGGLLSSAEDMAHFIEAVLNDRLLKPATREVMWTAQKTSEWVSTEYGLGWDVTCKRGFPEVGHSGGQQGTSTLMLVAPERRVAVIILINMEGASPRALSLELLKLLLNRPEGDTSH